MEQNLMVIRQHDLINNPSTRLPVCLCLDASASMNIITGGDYHETGETFEDDGRIWNRVTGGITALSELNKGIEYFFDAIKSDEIARYSVELSIVVFNDDAVRILDFANIDRQEVPILTATGMTSMGAGVELALNLLEDRKNEYSSKGIDYYQPWMVLMTDGFATDNTSNAISRVQSLSKKKKLILFPVAIGDEADKNTLKQFSTFGNSMVMKVQSAEYFKEFFEWLSQSVSVASQSVPGDKPKLPPVPTVIEIEL